jgi:SAM-dependent methyltransferase
MGCGTGRLIPGLAAFGWRVAGYEPNVVYAAAARTRVAGVEGASVVTGGFLDLDEEQAFDLICAINDPFAHLTTVSDRRDALRRVRGAPVDGGVFVIDNPNFLWNLVNYRRQEVISRCWAARRTTRCVTRSTSPSTGCSNKRHS